MPTLASTSRVQLSYIKETTYGTTPVAGNGRNLRMTGESLDFNVSKEQSKEIRADRQVAGATSVDASVTGGFQFHMQYAEYDQFLEGAMGNLYSVYGTLGVGTTFTATFATGSITAGVAPTGTSDFSTNLQRGQWFKMIAPANANDGKYFRVHSVTAPTTTVITLDPSTPATAGAGVANCAVATSRIANGTTLMSFSLEENFTDITQFLTYKGCGVNKMALTLNSAALADGSFDFIGASMTRLGVTSLPGSASVSNVFEIMNTPKGIGNLWENGAPITTTFIKTMSINVDNNLRAQKALGTFGNVGLGQGDFAVSGQIEVYFADGTIIDKFLADTYTALTVTVADPAKNGYAFSMPRVLLMNGKVNAGSKNADAMLSFDYMAFSDDANAVAALRKTLFIDRCGVATT